MKKKMYWLLRDYQGESYWLTHLLHVGKEPRGWLCLVLRGVSLARVQIAQGDLVRPAEPSRTGLDSALHRPEIAGQARVVTFDLLFAWARAFLRRYGVAFGLALRQLRGKVVGDFFASFVCVDTW